ncbi:MULTISPECIES: hypothetical protein [Pseudomonas]|jgi:hypothetical protein|uniref:hypothetical protein n=1 Tax=Pseudomonas TaxID=286 RepID=UPI0005786B89|nr:MULTISPECIES: hypothetical protein [Pseudomonas]GLH20213.1 hypothetical protein BR1R3_29550 [Pseudomonas atacamensis]
MEKRLSDRDDSIIAPVKEPSKGAAKEVIAQPSAIIFCVDPDDPIIGKIKAGRRVSYEVIKSDTGQQYAINVRLVSDRRNR